MFLMTSKFQHYEKDENGVRKPCVIPDENGILTLIRENLIHQDQLLIIANDPQDFVANDDVATVLASAFKMTGIKFKQVTILDQRTAQQAAALILSADLIFMCGGEILRQLTFLKQIAFKTLIKDYAGVVITVSAASMCLTRTICNFPEHTNELSQPRLVSGLGLLDMKLIPHFDGATLTYQGTTDFPNLVQDYILPYSDKDHICGLPNGSFILLDDSTVKYFGPHCDIFQRKVVQMGSA